MAKYIAHASINERGKIKGGSAGDSTKKEVCIRTWYSKPWNYVLRIKNEKVRIQFANNMIDIANNNKVGYDQNQRNTLLTQAKKVDFDFTKITVKCECDCSSMVTIALLGAIYTVLGKEEYEKAYKVLVVSGNCATTSTLRSRLNKLSMIIVYSSKTYTGGTSKALFGDIYIKEGSHVVVFIDNGKKVEEDTDVLELQKAINLDLKPVPLLAEDNEKGAKTKAQMKKIVIKKPKTGSNKDYPNITRFVQNKVGAEPDGKYGTDTERLVEEYQRAHGLEKDGVVGYNTLNDMVS